ncbi:MAG TPA: TRAP transporter substrate-binding protein DctP [Solirubrobacter sp.]|nr:TRAP transporter substrate-binding protein DctP [Solirubrobacter sp.]
MTSRRLLTTAAIALTAIAFAAGCDRGDKAGGAGGPVTLRIGTDDTPGRPSGVAIEELARQARRLSGGQIRIEPVYQAAGRPAPAWDQRVAHMVRDGKLDLGVIPARAWDTEGVTSLRALHAPFLVTSNSLVDRIARGDLGAEMLRGLDRAGVVGLALLPEDLRHPFAFGRPFLTRDDFAGKAMRVPRSSVAYATFRALGATPRDLVNPELQRAIADGSVAGVESGFALAAAGLPRRATVTVNVTPFPKVNSLVINRGTWQELDDGQRATLREAARRTLAAVLRTRVPEDAAARRYCAAGGRVVLAGDADVAAMVAAVQPVYDELQRDATIRHMIVRLRALKAELPPDSSAVAAPCAPARAGTTVAAGTDAHALDGVWRMDVTYEEGVEAGLPADVAGHEMGLQTIRMEGGRYDWRWRARDGEQRCPGVYRVTGDRVILTDQGECSGMWEATFTRAGRTLRWGRPRALTRDAHEQTIRNLLHGKPWRLIQEVRSREPAFPEGVYRADVPAALLVARGVDPGVAATNSGLMTMTFKAGRWLHHTQSPSNEPDCGGRYAVVGGRVTVTLDPGPECGSSAGSVLFSAAWTLRGGELRFTDVRSGDGDEVFARAAWGVKPWRKIG